MVARDSGGAGGTMVIPRGMKIMNRSREEAYFYARQLFMMDRKYTIIYHEAKDTWDIHADVEYVPLIQRGVQEAPW
jgi:hypothetical protein